MEVKAVCQCSRADSDADLLERIREIAIEYRGKEGNLIQVLHIAQGIFGYLPVSVQEVVADALELPLTEVSGVVTFYSFFSTQPRGEHTIRVCLGTACYVRGGKKIVERLKKCYR
ncbi:MAG: NAD(P)H-dependent oxidoreductase subunit E [Lachnospiraceae bacterium]